MKIFYKISLFIAGIGLFAACTSDDTVLQKTNDLKTPVGVTFAISESKAAFNGNVSTKATGEMQDARTRTSITHTLNNGAEAYWEASDYIWVKDNTGTWQKSIATQVKHNGASASFTLPGSVSDYSTGCEVRYTGNSNQPDQVNISTTRTQTNPNQLTNAGTIGDCGIGYATKEIATNIFTFKLTHKAAYLCFLPREMDTALGANIYLTRIVINSDDAIAGNYSFSNTGLGSTPNSGASNVVTLTTKGTGAYANGFPLTNNASNLSTNGAYAIIAPGAHNLTIQYYLYDPTTRAEGFIVKKIQGTFPVNTVTPITANCNVTTVALNSYYYWDAKQYAWYGNESAQPTENGTSANLGFSFQYGVQSSDPRAPRSNTRNVAATESCKDCPNSNEIAWYVLHGDPRWDANGIFAFANHLRNGGIWILKKEHIAGYSSALSPDGVNRSISAGGNISDTYQSISYFPNVAPGTAPDIFNRNKYFFLPATGTYTSRNATAPAILENLGTYGAYWGSDGRDSPPNRNYALVFDQYSFGIDDANIQTYSRILPVWKAQ